MSKYSGSKKPVKLLTSRFLRNNPKQFWKQLNWFGLSQMEINKIKAKAIFPCKKLIKIYLIRYNEQKNNIYIFR